MTNLIDRIEGAEAGSREHSPNGSICLTDVRRGLIDALILVRSEIGRQDCRYDRPPAHHVRLLAEREARTAPLRKVAARLQQKIDALSPAAILRAKEQAPTEPKPSEPGGRE